MITQVVVTSTRGSPSQQTAANVQGGPKSTISHYQQQSSMEIYAKNFQFKTVCEGDMAYITQLKQQK